MEGCSRMVREREGDIYPSFFALWSIALMSHDVEEPCLLLKQWKKSKMPTFIFHASRLVTHLALPRNPPELAP